MMKSLLTMIGAFTITSSAFAGAALSEKSMCSFLNGDAGTQVSVEVINSQADGYSHRIELSVNKKSQVIASVEGLDNSAMDKYYFGSFPIVVDGNEGSLKFDGEAQVNAEGGPSADTKLRKATFKLQGAKAKTLLCIVK
jgi:hypothetical protein